jgi:hypothetical protein
VNRESGTVLQRYTELREVIKDCNDPLQIMTLLAFLSLYSDSCGVLNKTCEAMCAAVCSQVLRFYCEEKNSLSPESLWVFLIVPLYIYLILYILVYGVSKFDF